MTDTIPDIFLKKQSMQTAADLEQRANSVIDGLRPQYIAGTSILVSRLEAWVTAPLTDDVIVGAFFRAAHDIKGQGATFGFPLMTALGDHMCKRIKAGAPFTPKDIASFALDIADMRRVLENGLTDDGGVQGAAILKRLEG